MDLELLIKSLADRDAAMLAKLTGIDNTIGAEKKAREELEAKLNRMGFQPIANADGINPAEVKAFGEAFRTLAISNDKSALNDLLTKTSSYAEVGSDPAGGFAVYPSVSSAITKKVFELSPIRQEARVVPIGTDAFEEILDLEEPGTGWEGETQVPTDTAVPNIGKLRIVAHELRAMPKATQKILDDSAIDVGAWLVDKLGRKFAKDEGAGFVNGNGVGRPVGFMSYAAASVTTSDATRAWGVLQHVITGAAAAFATSAGGDCLITMTGELKAEYAANAKWFMNRRTGAAVAKLKDDQKQYLWQRSLIAGQPDMLLGHPIVWCADMDDLGAGTYPIAFGDMRAAYTIADRMGDRMLRDPYTGKPFVKFYTTRRVGGDVNNFEALKLLKCST